MYTRKVLTFFFTRGKWGAQAVEGRMTSWSKRFYISFIVRRCSCRKRLYLAGKYLLDSSISGRSSSCPCRLEPVWDPSQTSRYCQRIAGCTRFHPSMPLRAVTCSHQILEPGRVLKSRHHLPGAWPEVVAVNIGVSRTVCHRKMSEDGWGRER